MKFLLAIILITQITAEEWDVTSGIVRRNWSLRRNGAHVGWFTSAEACQASRKLFYKDFTDVECLNVTK